MRSSTWRPLGAAQTSNLYEALHDGVPPWMKKSLTNWLQEILTILMSDYEEAVATVHRIEQDLRAEISVTGYTPESYVSSVVSHFMQRNESLVLADYLLSRADVGSLSENANLTDIINNDEHLFGRLELLLSRSGSMWRVGMRYENRLGLIKRVPEGIQSAADDVMRTVGHAGKTLALAWGEVFGHNPNPREAYRLAVEAVEDAAIPQLGLAPASMPTLGSVIRTINGPKRDASEWTLPLQREDEHYSNGQTIIAMLKSLWAGQVDRHGGEHELDNKLRVDQAAAETAVLLAVPLVQWFSSGAIHKKYPPGSV